MSDTVVMSFKVSEAERQAIRIAAARAGENVSEFIRQTVRDAMRGEPTPFVFPAAQPKMLELELPEDAEARLAVLRANYALTNS